MKMFVVATASNGLVQMMMRERWLKEPAGTQATIFPALFFEVERLLNAEQSVCQKDDTDDNRDECDYKVTFKDNEAAEQNQYQGNEQIVAEEKRLAAACNVADQRNNAAKQEQCSGDITDQQTRFYGVDDQHDT